MLRVLRDLSGNTEIPLRGPGQLEQQDRAAAKPSSAGEPPAPREPFVQLTATRDHLRFVFMKRNVLLLAVCAGMALAAVTGGFSLVSPWLAVVGLAAVLNLSIWLRLKRAAPVSYREFLFQILADVALIGAAVHYTGGEASPFLVLNLVPLMIAAATLPWPLTLIVALAVLGCHELVCLYPAPLPEWLARFDRVGEMLAAGLITYFVFCMARTSRRHERLLAQIRENYLKQRHSAELGTLAAAAADQLGSPLATMAVVVGELRDDPGRTAEHKQALEVMAKQIETCKQVSSGLLASAGHRRAEGGGKVAADKFCAAIVDKCELMQPWMSVQYRSEGRKPAPEILAESSLEQAILVLLKSAPGTALRVEISISWDEKRLQIRLCDCAPRPRADARGYSGAPLFARTALAPADHLDLLMAKTTIGRFGGTVEDPTHTDGRVCVKLSLALFGVLAGSP